MANFSVFKFILLASVVTFATAAPVQQACEKTPVRDLLHMLGEHKRFLQPFSPRPLCNGEIRKLQATAKKIDETIGNTEQMTELNPRQATRQEMWDKEDGCTTEDVNLLMIKLPEASSTCSWTIKCDYNRQRFPPVLYQAKLTLSGTAGIACNCRPDVRDVVVLTKTHKMVGNVSCPAWERFETKLTVAYNCNTVNFRNVLV